MKRYFITLAVCAALVSPLLADYLVIRINLGADQILAEGGNDQGPSLGGNRFGAGAGGGRGLGGAGLGGGDDTAAGGSMRPGGKGGGSVRGPGGGPGLGGGLSGPGGGASLGGGRGPGGGPGLGGGLSGPGGGASLGGGRGPGGGPGLGGGLSGPGGGASLGGGRGPGGGPGLGGGLSGPGGGASLGGGRGLGGGFNPGRNGQNDNQPAGFVTNKGDLFIVATEVIVSKNARNPNTAVLTHKWGQTVLSPETELPDRAVMQIIKVPGLESRLKTKRAAYLESGNKQYMKLAEWMLENWNMPAEGRFSMQSSFEAYLNELNSLAANLSASDKAKVDAMLAVKTQLSKPGAAPTQEMELVKALMPKIGNDYKSTQKGHFLVYYPSNHEKLIETKLNRMEEAYNGIMYWFALQGNPLPVPAKQLVCVVADAPDKFQALHKMFDDAPMYTSDGFYSSLDNITILAPSRVDAGYEKFAAMAKSAQTNLQSHNLDFKKVLNERTDKPYVSSAGNDKQKLADIVTGQIFAIAEKAAIDEGDTATATMEAFHQICASTGYMPRSVLLPRSVRDGLTSFFSTPKSSGEHNLPALWSGIGGEHWLHLPLFRKMSEVRAKSSEDPSMTVDAKLPTRHSIKIGKLDVMAVVTDRVFDKAEKAAKDDKEFLMQKAEAESWALTYYLAKSRLPELKKFYDELAQMPRDLELSPDVLEQAFGRSFDLLDASGEKLDKTKVQKFETDWTKYMNFANLAVETGEKTASNGR